MNGSKTRAVYACACVRECDNRGKKCDKCLRFDNFKPIIQGDQNALRGNEEVRANDC